MTALVGWRITKAGDNVFVPSSQILLFLRDRIIIIDCGTFLFTIDRSDVLPDREVSNRVILLTEASSTNDFDDFEFSLETLNNRKIFPNELNVAV